MKETENLIPSLTHILIRPTTSPGLHSQLFISTCTPQEFHTFDFYPRLQDPSHFLFSLRLFLSRLRPRHVSSWRCRCPFLQPPPLVLAPSVEPAMDVWGLEERRLYFRKRLNRGRLGLRMPTLLAVLCPNLLVISSVLLWDPIWK